MNVLQIGQWVIRQMGQQFWMGHVSQVTCDPLIQFLINWLIFQNFSMSGHLSRNRTFSNCSRTYCRRTPFLWLN